jgi:hypothetical protein
MQQQTRTAGLDAAVYCRALLASGGNDQTAAALIKRWNSDGEASERARAALVTKAAVATSGSIIDEMITLYDSKAGEGCNPVLLLIDEAGTAPVPGLPEYAATVAGRGISILAAFQDLNQQESVYGRSYPRGNCSDTGGHPRSDEFGPSLIDAAQANPDEIQN